MPISPQKRKITFVGTVHDENGLCNAEALLELLRTIEPDVVFEELRPSDFDSFYATKHTTETKALSEYRKHRLIKQVPIDRYDIPENLISTFKEMLNNIFDYVEQKSQECWLLKDEIDRNTGLLGFKYLNSIDHARKWARICEIQDKTIFGTGNQRLIRILQIWRQQQHRREIEMLGNIYEYCRENVFETGVFLVGASHKMGIAREIEKYAATETNLITWNFAYDGKIP